VFEYLEISLLSFLPSTCNTGRVGRVLEGRALSFDPHGKRRDLRLIDRAIVAAYQGVQLHRSFMASWGTYIKSAPLHFQDFCSHRRENGSCHSSGNRI